MWKNKVFAGIMSFRNSKVHVVNFILGKSRPFHEKERSEETQ